MTDWSGMSDREVLVQIATKQDGMIITLDNSIKECRDGRKELRVEVSDSNDRTDRKVGSVHKRIDSMRWWSSGLSVLAGFFGGFFGSYTQGGR